MIKETFARSANWLLGSLKGALTLAFIFLLIEFFDEFNYTVEGAALPSIRADLSLTYAQVGLLLGLPHVLGSFIEPVIMLLGDTPWRKRLVIGGGLALAGALATMGSAATFPILLLAMIVTFPASGAFVTLSQVTLIDSQPGREAQMMARWTAAGSLGNLIGPLFLAAGFALGLGWRWMFFVLAILASILTLVVWLRPFPARHPRPEETGELAVTPRVLLHNLWETVRNPRLLRWLALLELSDLLLDGFTGYVPLYLADNIGLSESQASLVFSLFLLTSLIADLALIPLLERVPGRTIVRLTSAAALALYPALLLAPWLAAKIVLLMTIRFTTLGWYPVLEGEAFASAPGKSGTYKAVSALTGFVSGAIAWFIGWVAGLAGLQVALWLLLVGPVCLLLFVPKPVISKQ
jgi:FSR family fosmidomycin resistance protein-like MFS transporter